MPTQDELNAAFAAKLAATNAVPAFDRLDSFEETLRKLNPSLPTGLSLRPPDVNTAALRYVTQDIPTMAMLEDIKTLAHHDYPVLISGPTGTGKEILASILHEPRRPKPFSAPNCGGLPEHLVESELFGYKANSFTGAASRDHVGLIKATEGGTLFLDEIGELPLHLQAKLLRFLESGEIRPVGSTEFQIVKCRIVAATNADLDALVAQGKFRGDLLARINAFHYTTTPLTARRGDIPLILSKGFKCPLPFPSDPAWQIRLARDNCRALRAWAYHVAVFGARYTGTVPASIS